MLDHCKGRAVQPSRISRHEAPFSSLTRLTHLALDLDNLVRLQRNGHNDSRTYIGTAPSLTTTPEFKANAKLIVRHERGGFWWESNTYSAKPSQ